MENLFRKCFMALFCAVCSMAFTSCKEVLKPDNASKPDVLDYVYTQADTYVEDGQREQRREACEEGGWGAIWGFKVAADELSGPYKCRVPHEDKVANTRMLEWHLDEDSDDSDEYIGYLVTYEVTLVNRDNLHLYVLGQLTEFLDESNRYEFRVVAIENSIAEINSDMY